MSGLSLRFDAVNEATPGPKWAERWARSWPAYEAWFISRGGDTGPSPEESRKALQRHMPELVPVYDRLLHLAGGGDRAAQFLSTWCPPRYLGGCSLAALSDGTDVRLVRNYDLSPDLNEGLLLRSEWLGRPVMGMVEFLWGLSDGINEAGLAVALAYGGRSDTAMGFGITTILRYVLETCDTVEDALAVLRRIPSHMAYNVVLADRSGRTASVELSPGGGCRVCDRAIATNHQADAPKPERAAFTRTFERHRTLGALGGSPVSLVDAFLRSPLYQDRHAEGLGTLFTCEYDPATSALTLIWPDRRRGQSLSHFTEGSWTVIYGASTAEPEPAIDWSRASNLDWSAIGRDYASGRGRPVEEYLSRLCRTASG